MGTARYNWVKIGKNTGKIITACSPVANSVGTDDLYSRHTPTGAAVVQLGNFRGKNGKKWSAAESVSA